ncbi:hypothetical protein [Desulfoscipio geothermicus]|uniref:Uncharacterized protein n=1 Tax=Desulfoscipio geothermicus DSM 3669 TaxID=1121426 RepID=A0A1I6DDS1_9FIRM|nr:hypothetical protein [Desulfoscipio geothermicus]SFR03452.1 hypothetical protein SAMN05660706_10931 [Desulfoscipio geothermicus DSM 3669]
MFDREVSPAGWITLTLTSIALTVPFIFIMKNMADSLHTIAEHKTRISRIKKYGM